MPWFPHYLWINDSFYKEVCVGDAPKVVGILCGRMDSSRFPGKMLAPLCGIPLATFVYQRAKSFALFDEVIFATSDRKVDEPLAEEILSQGGKVFRGPLEDVAGRFLRCAQEYGGDYFMRLNGDSPCLDKDLLGEAISYKREGYDLVTNILKRTYPYGVSAELVNVSKYGEVHPQMNKEDQEHVTRYFYSHQEEFKIKELLNPSPWTPSMAFTVDLPEDLERMNDFFKDNPDRSWKEMMTKEGVL